VYSIGDARFVDGAPLTEWSTGSSNADSRKEYSRLETDGDEMRLAYVALTRAIYQTVIWWANTKGMGASPMAKILFDQTGKSRESLKVPKDDEVRNRLAALKAKSMNNISIVELPPNIAPKPLSQFGPESLQLPTAARLKRRHLSRREFWRWSYSTVKDSISDHELIHAAGNDEPYQPSLNVSESSGGALQDQPAGAEYGSWFHAVMEQLNFDAPDLPVHIGEVLDGAPFDGASRAAHVTGIAAVIQTPIHSVAADFSLRNLARQNRLDESEFLIGLGIGDQPVQLSRLAEVVASDMSHPFASYFARMAQTVGRKQYQGLLTGSLDGLYRVPSEGGKGFLIVDFKSNKLGDYGYESMKLEMERHDYPLQALLYSVGLHRFLKMKLGGYQPHLHLGGSAYLFVRGMRGADTPIVSGVTEGVFHWRYSPELIEEVSRWCMGGPSQ
jgi:exodeoxyribonuclease V beta subunit